jgi:hypothetical protein
VGGVSSADNDDEEEEEEAAGIARCRRWILGFHFFFEILFFLDFCFSVWVRYPHAKIGFDRMEKPFS